MLYNIFVVILLIVVIFEYWYIIRLRKVIEYAAETLKKFGEAILNDVAIRKADEDESKTSKTVFKK